jgi:hypothetical protein
MDVLETMLPDFIAEGAPSLLRLFPAKVTFMLHGIDRSHGAPSVVVDFQSPDLRAVAVPPQVDVHAFPHHP